ncbi:MAG: acyl-CoA thioesterase [Ferrovibrio sp.]|uniref:acyl-CoA thioesterase n=1 Tax=Ferrovibrio sp. TaxID=1917215 RepID=UPI00262481BC|nr:thioesterase family protein [Ferrovibrio sp.]MCW0233224.1 acyl-CoA thioesterase [Ferrovibrio sp.]
MTDSSPYTPDRPFAAARIVQWGECDPAGMVYTTQFLDYVMETLEAFWRDVIGYSFLRLHKELGFGSPTVSTKLDFQRALKGGDPFTVELRVEKLSRSTITYDFKGRNAAGEVCFTGTHVSCIVDEKILKSVEIPDTIRGPIEAYRRATTPQA